MADFFLKPNSAKVKAYYQSLKEFQGLGISHETAVRSAFQSLLDHCARKLKLKLVPEYGLTRSGRAIRLDGAILDEYRLAHGYWEAKDSQDNLATEVKKKFAKGYPRENILFQSPDRAILYQNGICVLDADLRDPNNLVHLLESFFHFKETTFDDWRKAVDEFSARVEEMGKAVLKIIRKERKENRAFITAFRNFHELCRTSINPGLSSEAVEEMLIQHLLTERIFRRVFNNPDFTRRNIIAAEIEKVIDALASRTFSRGDFLKKLDPFYTSIEATASEIKDYAQKQDFLNTIYERFFQGFAVKVADTHGIVYTPQSIVDFMVRSVDAILKKEFNTSLSDQNVHILDPFVGTGNFILRVMNHIPRTALKRKYRDELHCNEVMLLPYYIASMNIEHLYYELTGEYAPFEGICLVDTFETAEPDQAKLSFMNLENTERVKRQKEAPIKVIIGNPPYNAGQVNENDNNKNRKYKVIDKRVKDTYGVFSTAQNKNALSDPYVKAFRWASDRIQNGGILAYVSNNGYLDAIAFDGMRKCLSGDFDRLYLLDLGGNVRKNPKLSGTTHNVFGIQVGVCIGFFIRRSNEPLAERRIYYARVEEYRKRIEKYDFLDDQVEFEKMIWSQISPDKKNTWLTDKLDEHFEDFIPLGMRDQTRNTGAHQLFCLHSNGVKTNRDAWAYNSSGKALAENVIRMASNYNDHVMRWLRSTALKKSEGADPFIDNNPHLISWSLDLKKDMMRGHEIVFSEEKIRTGLYRPFSKRSLFFDSIMNERVYQQPKILPTKQSEIDNLMIACSAVGQTKPFQCLLTNAIPDIHLTGDTQCFSLYVYNEDGTNKRDNITDGALAKWRDHYHDDSITKEDLFYYVYGLLHSPQYRKKYAANLRRELPRIPFSPDFWAFSKSGRSLADLHLNYEDQKPYALEQIETPGEKLNLRVERMRLSKDKTELKYNDFLTLKGIPPEVFDYKLGHRSALEWVIDQYRITEGKQSGIINNPNREDDEEYILRLIGQVITVSLKTNEIVQKLPAIENEKLDEDKNGPNPPIQ